MGAGVVSDRTAEQIAELRRGGVLFAVVSGEVSAIPLQPCFSAF
jgi:hypothetical protein